MENKWWKNFEDHRWLKIAISIACLVLGLMLAVQFQNVQHYRENLSAQRSEELVKRLNEAEKARAALAQELEEAKNGILDDAAKKEQERLMALAGFTPLKGTGIRVTLDDSKQTKKPGENANLYIIHDEDLLKVINELRASGAEAIAVNEQRLLATSEIRCVGPTVLVNDVRYSPPYEVTAIGDPKTMEAALKLRGGVAESLQFWGVQIEIKQENNLVIPAYEGNFHFKLAKPVEQEKKS